MQLASAPRQYYIQYYRSVMAGQAGNRHCQTTSTNILHMDTPNQRIAKMTFASVYPLYLAKVEKKGRTKEELHQVIEWLTGFDDKQLQNLIKENVTFESFFQDASLNPNAQSHHRINLRVPCGGNRGSFDTEGKVSG